ncbi:amidohydrolase [Corynebacterium heidelbergense]|uniref:Amidohydrolase n=1 Tax=Corynebacterium heidelbergense TaxID=2055947 RepID=A0A364V7Q3_9CORY|nr:amidohydrolase [Corynebacterium heidelbergense]RAV32667.1 amidohydrolase [Corynebacterium heidelbergense]
MTAPRTPAAIVADTTADLSWQEDLYKYLHAHPELSGAEEQTAERIEQELQRFPEWEVTPKIGGHGIAAVLRNGEGPTVLFRADFDGLPVAESTDVDYASKHSQLNAQGERVPTMHACGHDHHTTSLLGAMAILTDTREHWSGTVVAIFQPAEEASIGAHRMVTDGLGKVIPRPDVCLAQHVVAGPAGRVFTAPGPVMTSSTTIEITLYGRGAHASMPDRSVDPVVLAASTVMRLQTIVSREVPPGKFAVVTVASVEAGKANNVIPDSAKIALSCRFYDEELRKKCVDAIKRIVRAEAVAAGAEREPDFKFVGLLGATDNSPQVFGALRPAFDEAFGEDSTDMEPWSASEDFPVLPKAFGVPYLLWTVGITPRKQWERAVRAGRLDIDIPTNHNPGFLPDLSTLPVATKAAAVGVLACLQSQWPSEEERAGGAAAPSTPTDREIDEVAVETSGAE